MRSHLSALALGLLPLAAVLHQDTAPETPIELGDVAWLRDLDVGRTHAAVLEKPVLLVFQEVPG